MLTFAGSTLSTLIDLVLPRSCIACGAADGPLCRRCTPAQTLRAHDSCVPGGLALVAAAEYDGAVRTALLAYKERGRRDLAAALGGLLVRAIGDRERASPAHRRAVLVPVPSTSAARRARGGDHARRLADVAAGRQGLAVARPLRIVRAVQDSAGLDTAGRAANLAGAMMATPPERAGSSIAVLVDDIATTGATLREAVRALRTAGWQVSGAAVVAATRRRRSSGSRGDAHHTGLAWA